ncbi:MAG: aminoacetone oxidase family FAD-binding enzyme, partial [Lachnospiraceae bacterium]|nr:aminoacetone oxidase family FAD-binding enzyme [Lachnospiraceae bacterium]
VIRQFDCDQTVSFFQDLGMLLEDKNGYLYPRSEQASSILDILRFRCEDLGIDIVTNYQPMKISRKKGFFYIDDEYTCQNLVIATGGMSVPKTGSDGSGYEYAKSFGHAIVDPIPCLCALRCSDPFFKELAGVRNDSTVTLLDDAKNPLMTVTGNLQFNDYGVSGIPIFQISSIAGRMLKEGKQLSLRIDLLPEISIDDLTAFLDQKKDHMLLGILNKKLANVIEKEARKKTGHENETPGYVRAVIIKKFKVHPVALNPFAEAQVTAGGVSVNDICPDTCASKLVDNLYFAGEIIDINGICGGYNLQWAWATAFAVSKALKAQL